jgi:DNA-binding NarL/FixJ family response regulator
MKIIKVSITGAGEEEFPRCRDLLETCPEISVLAHPGGLLEAGIWMSLGRSDILILNESVIKRDGVDAAYELHASYPSIRSLLVIEKHNKNKILTALSMGIKGVITRDSLFSGLLKAITTIHAGEAWVPRGLVEPLRDKLAADTKVR